VTLFHGVHEVRLLCPNRVAVGYFDNWEAAIQTVEREGTAYKAAYFSLNPIKLPEGINVNPETIPSSRNAAEASDIERRVHLLIDCDPPRKPGTNSTDEEKQAALEEANKIREWLRSQGWPEPALCDSGNGWHLLYRIELPTDEDSSELLKNFLARLKQLFPMVDAGNFDAPRICKLYGTWARKGENTEERPWRRSAIIEEGSGVIVTEEQLRALAPVPESPSKAAQRAKGDEDLSRLLGFLECYEVPLRSDPREVKDGWQIEIECPWADEHGGESRRDTVVSFIAGRGYGFKCFHGHCLGRRWQDFRAELQRRFPDKKFAFVESTSATATIGGTAPAELVADWRTHYHTFDEMQNAPPASFLIEGFLQLDAITALAAPVAQRKSLVALNVAHALCTRAPLFDYFDVTKQPTRVLYLCPEMGIRSFTDRLRKIGLMPYVGKTLFCRTMSAEGTLELAALTPEELDGAAVIIDTAVRYLRGDENSSEHMRAFAEDIFRLMRDGAISVLLLHHSAKGTKESSELTLENAMRGSGELGAFVASCWATRLQQPDEPYHSASYLKNVKQRDFESEPFEVTSGPDCRLHIVDKPGDHVKLSSKSVGAQSDADGREADALQIIKNNPALSLSKLVDKMAANGIKRSRSWVGRKKAEVLGTGVKSSA